MRSEYRVSALADDPPATFIFGTCNATGFTFHTRHYSGDRNFYFTD